MKFLTNERLSEHRYKTPEGYLVCTDAILARTGKQTYKRNEVFADSNDESEIEIDRTPEEVFSEQTLASFENKPLTVEHPDEDVNVHNYKDYAVGFVRDVRRGVANGQDVILGNLVITDEDTIKEVENGEHTELSCGYDCDIIDEEHPCQRNIRGNHVALCEQGRAGIARIIDSEKQKYAVEFAYAGDSFSKYLTAVWVMANSKEEALKKAEKWANTKYDETSNFKIVNKAYTNSEIIDSNIDDSAELEKLMKTCQSVASIFADKTNEIEQKILYSSLFNLVKDITEKADKETDASKLLELSKTLDNYASRAKFHSIEAKLLGLAKELYRCYERNKNQFKDSLVNDVNPRKGESEKEFISRFMSETKNEYPDEKQRLAVAYSYWRNKNKDSTTCDEEQKFVIKFDMGPRRIIETYTSKEKADERYKELQVKFANKGVKIMKMYDAYNKYANEKDINFLKEAISEMKRYERNWSFMTQRERQNISWNGIAGLREDIKNAENRLKELTSKTDSVDDALIPPPESILKEFEQILTSNGYTIESRRNNMFGGVHYQIRSKKRGFDDDSFTEEYKRVARALHSFDEKHSHNPPITWNFGLMNDGSITAGLDVRELYVKD